MLDISVKCLYNHAMTKTTAFRQAIKINRKFLISKGFKPSTLTTWQYGKRSPLKKMARKLSNVLNISLDDIPYIERFVKNK